MKGKGRDLQLVQHARKRKKIIPGPTSMKDRVLYVLIANVK